MADRHNQPPICQQSFIVPQRGVTHADSGKHFGTKLMPSSFVLRLDGFVRDFRSERYHKTFQGSTESLPIRSLVICHRLYRRCSVDSNKMPLFRPTIPPTGHSEPARRQHLLWFDGLLSRQCHRSGGDAVSKYRTSNPVLRKIW